jgi:outer membrane protein OmpA-like peptidoglycan-associated protein
MSLRYSSSSPAKNFKRALLAAAFSTLLIGVAYAANLGTDIDPRLLPPVQNYAEQAVPIPGTPAPQGYYDSPLAAGTLTLQDVLEAHKPNPETSTLPAIGATPTSTATAPILTPPPQASSTSLMMSQGMRAVLQKVGETTTTTPSQMRPPSLTGQPVAAQQAQGQPASLLPPSVAGGAVAALPAPVSVGTAPGVKYEPGQEPRNLAGNSAATPVAPASPGASIAASVDQATTVPLSMPEATTAAGSASSSLAPTQSCDKDVQKWEKSCGDAGYPATYIGKIIGETHVGCADGTLHDVWVSNTCAPPDASSASSPATDGACGQASNNQFDDTPVSNLCAQGIASAVNGSGPWTWACSGVNGGQPAACSAGTRVAPVNAECGPANGAAASSAPTGDLCNMGSSTAVHGDGPWTWSCRGIGGGSTQSCIAPVASAVSSQAVAVPIMAPPPIASEGEPETAPMPIEQETTAAPVAPAPVAAAIVSKYSSPASKQSYKATAPTAPSVAAKTQAVAPVSTPPSVTSASGTERGELCGAAAETLAYEAPDKDLCRAGSASAVNGDGPWSWSCTDNEGRSSSCRTLSLTEDNASTPASSAPVSPASPSSGSLPAVAVETAPTANVPAPTPSSHTEADTITAALAPASGELACGAAAVESASQMPTDDLCVNGSPSPVKGSGPWHWSCSGPGKKKQKISCETSRAIDARCGPANGTALKSAPFSGLCSVGVPSGVDGNGPWAWNCEGIGGGVTVSCAATVQQSAAVSSVDGTCGASANTTRAAAPGSGLCATGSPSSVSGSGPWTWSCSGTGGGSVSSCGATKMAATAAPGPAVNGLCGAANGVTATAQPVDGLCASGSVASIVGNGPWNWSCLGENSGMTVSCTAPLEPPAPIDGICGEASGVPTLSRPQSALCSSGITGAVSGHGPWTWTCSGANGGSPSSCVAPSAGKNGGAMPSLTTSDNSASNSVTAAPAAGLITPRLPGSPSSSLPALDRKVIPNLTPSRVPAAVSLDNAHAPAAAPDINGEQPVPPPAIGGQLVSSADMQEAAADRASHIPGNHLALDPTISTILFTRGSGNIDEPVIPALERLSGVLQTNPDVRITLTAYADNSDSTPRDARRLSLARALAIRDYLASKGVSDSRVDVRAEGANTTTGYIDRVDIKVNE